ncbi:MAG: hypothetical protein ABI355_15930 [Solirubrobacteraceae bacterium]
MRPFVISTALVLAISAPAVALYGSAPGAPASVSSAPRLVAFRGFHLHLGGGEAFGRHRVGFGGFGRRGSHGVLRRVVHALAFAYLLHLFFSHGGLSFLLWLLVIGLVVHLFRRRRRRRYSY